MLLGTTGNMSLPIGCLYCRCSCTRVLRYLYFLCYSEVFAGAFYGLHPAALSQLTHQDKTTSGKKKLHLEGRKNCTCGRNPLFLCRSESGQWRGRERAPLCPVLLPSRYSELSPPPPWGFEKNFNSDVIMTTTSCSHWLWLYDGHSDSTIASRLSVACHKPPPTSVQCQKRSYAFVVMITRMPIVCSRLARVSHFN